MTSLIPRFREQEAFRPRSRTRHGLWHKDLQRHSARETGDKAIRRIAHWEMLSPR